MTQSSSVKPQDLLARIADIIAGWERAESIKIQNLWVTDNGDWRAEWHERSGGFMDLFRGTENHLKVSRLISDLKEMLRGLGVGVNHIACPRPGTISVWTSDGQYFWTGQVQSGKLDRSDA